MAKADLAVLVDWFEESEEATRNARELSERDCDYYDNKQLTEAEVTELRKRGQPEIVINRIAPKIDFLVGSSALFCKINFLVRF